MSEPKLCPMAFGQGINPVIHPWFQCSQEACAWWVWAVIGRDVEAPPGRLYEGHCVMLDIGRTP
jgi:hypothetical protein